MMNLCIVNYVRLSLLGTLGEIDVHAVILLFAEIVYPTIQRTLTAIAKLNISPIKICTECWEPCTTAIKNMIVVKSGHVGGHITKKVVGELSTEKWEDVYDVETSLKYQAYVMGANAILKYKYIKHKNSKSTETGGTYYYNTFSGYGLAAVVEPNK